MVSDEEVLLTPNGDGTFSMTAKAHKLMQAALRRSTKFLYVIERSRTMREDSR